MPISTASKAICATPAAGTARVEGDLRNAGGWYGRAGREVSTAPLKEEWETIARAVVR
jgi:hypothetical protein